MLAFGGGGAESLWAFTAFGITGKRRMRPIYNNTEATEKDSSWLWAKRAGSKSSAVWAQVQA